MIALDLRLDSEAALQDWANEASEIIELEGTLRMLIVDGGMESGDASVVFGFMLDGKLVTAGTSLRLLSTGVRAALARYPLRYLP